MDNKDKKIIGYDANTGFPIYDNTELVNNPNIGKTITVKTSNLEVILLIILCASLPILFIGGIFKISFGVLACIAVLGYIILESIIYYDNVKKTAISNGIQTDGKFKITIFTGIMMFIYLFFTICHLASYTSLLGYVFSEESNPGIGWFFFLIYLPVYFFAFAIVLISGIILLISIKNSIKKCFGL